MFYNSYILSFFYHAIFLLIYAVFLYFYFGNGKRTASYHQVMDACARLLSMKTKELFECSANLPSVSWLVPSCCIDLFFCNLTICPWKFCRKICFEASWAVFWSLLCYKKLKFTINPFAGHTLRGILIQMPNITLRSLGMRRKQDFKIFSSLDFYFSLSLIAFLASFFSFAGH